MLPWKHRIARCRGHDSAFPCPACFRQQLTNCTRCAAERANEDQEEKTAGRRGLRQVEVIEVRLLQECCNLGPLRTAIKRNKLTKGHDMLTPDPVTEHLPGARDIPTDGHLSQVQTPDDRMSQGSICGVEGMMTVETFHKMLAAARHDEPMPLAEQMGGQETCHSDNNQVPSRT